MWCRKISERDVVKPNAAFTLVEMLMSLSLGTIILFTAIKFYSDYFISTHNQTVLFGLQKHSHQILDYLRHHIQHIGYQGWNRKDHNFSLFIDRQAYSLNHHQCFIFMYDLNSDGCIGSRAKKPACQLQNRNYTKEVSKEIFGFKLENKHITILNESKNIDGCVKNECIKILNDCQKFKWSKLSELSEYSVEQLRFSWIKAGELLKIELVLSSVKDINIQYSVTAYSYIFNSK